MKQSLIANQLSHLEAIFAEYEQNPVTWLLVMGHYPIYSNGAHGDSSELIAYLQPMLEQYHVHAYVAGHDHFHAHLQKNEIEYIIAGAGSMLDTPKYTSAASLLWSNANIAGFAYMDVASTHLTINYVSSANETIYSYTLQNPGPTKIVRGINDKMTINSPMDMWEWILDLFTPEIEVTVAMSSIFFMGLAIFVWKFYGKEKSKKEKNEMTSKYHKNVAYEPVDHNDHGKSLLTSSLTTATSWAPEDTLEDGYTAASPPSSFANSFTARNHNVNAFAVEDMEHKEKF
jgi:hypothetical protein